jgi:hypothetical protein
MLDKDLLTSKLYTYKVLVAESSGYYINVVATTPDEALEYARVNSGHKGSGIYEPYDRKLVASEPVEAELVEKEGESDGQ